MGMARTRLNEKVKTLTVSPGGATDAESEIKRVRHNIDHIDGELVTLLARRAEQVLEIGHLKGRAAAAVYRPEREAAIYKRLTALNRRSKLPDEALEDIFSEIISACRSLEAPLTVAYFGQKTSYTHLAALDVFGGSTQFLPCRTVAEVFDAVETQRAQHGVVPIENSTEGIVNVTLDLLLASRLSIIQETYLGIHHCLLSQTAKLSQIKVLYSHPQPFAQCRQWITRNLPHAELRETASTAEGAARAAREKKAAAIASLEASKEYKVPLRIERIEDQPDNFTRFVVVAREGKTERTGDDKTSLIFSIADEPGSLHHMLDTLTQNRINMTKILSRPSRRKLFDYSFFVDIDGHQDEPIVSESLKLMRKRAGTFRVLGSFPRSRRTPGQGRH